MNETRSLPYGIVWDRDNEVMKCLVCPPAHTYPLIGPFKNLDAFFADANIKSFMEAHQHQSQEALGETQ